MKKLSTGIHSLINELNGDISLYKRIKRADRVKEMWAGCVDRIFLEHTNSIFIFNDNEEKKLIVYVDESIFAAELNAQRELIKLRLLQKYNEDIDDFKIYISRGSYKKNYPFKETSFISENSPPVAIPLSNEEKQTVEELISCVEDRNLREKIRNAITADLEWKKGRNQKTNKQ